MKIFILFGMRRFNWPGFLSEIVCSETGLITLEFEAGKIWLITVAKGSERLTGKQL